MNTLIIFLGTFYIFLGFIFAFVPLVYLELGRPKDLLTASFNFFIGITLIIKNKVFENFSFAIFLLFTLVVLSYISEIFLKRWNQLTDKEKNNLTTLVEFRKNVLKIQEAVALIFSNLKKYLNFLRFKKNNEDRNKKKWVRNDKNDKNNNIDV